MAGLLDKFLTDVGRYGLAGQVPVPSKELDLELSRSLRTSFGHLRMFAERTNDLELEVWRKGLEILTQGGALVARFERVDLVGDLDIVLNGVRRGERDDFRATQPPRGIP